MSDARPVLLVHGAWHGAWCWAALQAELDRRAVPSYALDLPGHGVSLEPLGDLIAHVDHVVAVAERLAPAEVVLVGHSYGGAVVAGAAAVSGNVSSVVHLASFALLPGESVLDIVLGVPAPRPLLADAMELHDDGTSTLDPELAPAALYGSCTPELAAASVARLTPHAMASFAQAVPAVDASRARSIPTVYVRCLQDRAVPIEQQDVMAARCDEVVTLDTDHSPFASSVDEVADVLERLARLARLPGLPRTGS